MPTHRHTASDTASTFSMSTAYSYDKEAPTASKPKERRSMRQRMKKAIKDIGTAPWEAEDDKIKQSAAWLARLPPSRI